MPAVKRQNKSATDKPKRLRKRKARTDVSSSSESESSSDSESSISPESESDTRAKKVVGRNDKRVNTALKKTQRATSPSSSEDEQTTSINPNSEAADAKAEEAFTSFYLRQMTTEFAEDLDKVRSAGDFNDKSIGLLIGALKQGSGCFSKKERLDVGRAVVAADS